MRLEGRKSLKGWHEALLILFINYSLNKVFEATFTDFFGISNYLFLSFPSLAPSSFHLTLPSLPSASISTSSHFALPVPLSYHLLLLYLLPSFFLPSPTMVSNLPLSLFSLYHSETFWNIISYSSFLHLLTSDSDFFLF